MITLLKRAIPATQVLLAFAISPVSSIAGPPDPADLSDEHASPHTIWTRDTLTGDWGGLRSDLAELGIGIDLSMTSYYAGIFSGGVVDDAFDFGHRADAFVNFDFEKLGLWEGGGFRTHLESRFGEATSRSFPRSGGIWPPNTGVVVPLGAPERLVATSLYLTQRLGDSTNLMLGKINALDLLAADPFFGGWGRDRFTNIAFVAPPSGVVPPTIMGAILSHRAGSFSYTFMAFDPDDRTNDYWPDDLFSNGVNLSAAATWSGKVAERSSSVGISATYSTKESVDLSDFLLPPDLRSGTEEGAYNISLSFSHLLYELPDQPGKGFGIYGKAATADGNPNPIQGSFVGGFAGHGIVPHRPNDSFGIGYYYYNLSNQLQSAFSVLDPVFAIKDEQGIEVFYNLAVTPWFRLTADVQWIDPARAALPHAWVGGLRASVTF